MLIDIEIAFGAHVQIERAMPGDEIEHVIEKANAGLILEAPLAVEVEHDAYRGLRRVALDYGFAHRASSALTASCVYSTTPAVIRKQLGVDGSLVRSRTSTPRAISPSISGRAPAPPSISTKLAALFQ